MPEIDSRELLAVEQSSNFRAHGLKANKVTLDNENNIEDHEEIDITSSTVTIISSPNRYDKMRNGLNTASRKGSRESSSRSSSPVKKAARSAIATPALIENEHPLLLEEDNNSAKKKPENRDNEVQSSLNTPLLCMPGGMRPQTSFIKNEMMSNFNKTIRSSPISRDRLKARAQVRIQTANNIKKRQQQEADQEDGENNLNIGIRLDKMNEKLEKLINVEGFDHFLNSNTQTMKDFDGLEDTLPSITSLSSSMGRRKGVGTMLPPALGAFLIPKEILESSREEKNTMPNNVIESWLKNYENEKAMYNSFTVFAETKIGQLRHFNSTLGVPNVVTTAVACDILQNIAYSSPYGRVLSLLHKHLYDSIYPMQEEEELSNSHYIKTRRSSAAKYMQLNGSVWKFYSLIPYYCTSSKNVDSMFTNLTKDQKSDIMKDAISMRGVFKDDDLRGMIRDSMDVSLSSAADFLIKWFRTFANNENELAGVFMKVFKKMTSKERIVLNSKMWVAEFYNEEDTPMFRQVDGITINDEMFEFLKSNLDSAVGKALSDNFLRIETSSGMQSNLPYELRNLVEKVFYDMTTNEKQDVLIGIARTSDNFEKEKMILAIEEHIENIKKINEITEASSKQTITSMEQHLKIQLDQNKTQQKLLEEMSLKIELLERNIDKKEEENTKFQTTISNQIKQITDLSSKVGNASELKKQIEDSKRESEYLDKIISDLQNGLTPEGLNVNLLNFGQSAKLEELAEGLKNLSMIVPVSNDLLKLVPEIKSLQAEIAGLKNGVDMDEKLTRLKAKLVKMNGKQMDTLLNLPAVRAMQDNIDFMNSHESETIKDLQEKIKKLGGVVNDDDAIDETSLSRDQIKDSIQNEGSFESLDSRKEGYNENLGIEKEGNYLDRGDNYEEGNEDEYAIEEDERAKIEGDGEDDEEIVSEMKKIQDSNAALSEDKQQSEREELLNNLTSSTIAEYIITKAKLAELENDLYDSTASEKIDDNAYFLPASLETVLKSTKVRLLALEDMPSVEHLNGKWLKFKITEIRGIELKLEILKESFKTLKIPLSAMVNYKNHDTKIDEVTQSMIENIKTHIIIQKEELEKAENKKSNLDSSILSKIAKYTESIEFLNNVQSLTEILERFNSLKSAEVSILKSNKSKVEELNYLMAPIKDSERIESMNESQLGDSLTLGLSQFTVNAPPDRVATQMKLKKEKERILNLSQRKSFRQIKTIGDLALKSKVKISIAAKVVSKMKKEVLDQRGKISTYSKFSGENVESRVMNSKSVITKKRENANDPIGDKFIIVLLNKFAKEVGEKLKLTMDKVMSHRIRLGITIAMAAGRSAEVNRTLPPLIDVLISSFEQALMGKSRTKEKNQTTQTDISGNVDSSASNDSWKPKSSSSNSLFKFGSTAIQNAASSATALFRRPSKVDVKESQLKTHRLSKMISSTIANMSKNTKNFVKMDPTMLPATFRVLITSFKINAQNLERCSTKIKGEVQVLKIISEVMIDAVNQEFPYDDDSQSSQNYQLGHPVSIRENLAETVYTKFLNKFGLPSIADVNMIAFAMSLTNLRDKFKRIDAFAGFAFGEYSFKQLEAYIMGIYWVQVKAREEEIEKERKKKDKKAKNEARGKVAITVSSEEKWNIKMKHALGAIEKIFHSFKQEDYEKAETRVKELSTGGISNQSVIVTPSEDNEMISDVDGDADIDMDKFLMIVLDEWGSEQERRETYATHLFSAGDVDGDGKFTSSEFASSIRNMNPDLDDATTTRMFREAIQLSKGDSLEAQAYSEVCTRYGLLDKFWKSGGSIFSSTNNLDAMKHTWRKTGKFCVGTLENLKRDLAPHHKLRNCKMVGDGCLKCIQDRINGFETSLMAVQDTSEPDSTVIHSIEWQIYWLIVQELQRAAAQSNGIVTFYEASTVKNKVIPKQLSPRNTITTPASQRKRRHALPMIFFPDSNRITAVVEDKTVDKTGLIKRHGSVFRSSLSPAGRTSKNNVVETNNEEQASKLQRRTSTVFTFESTGVKESLAEVDETNNDTDNEDDEEDHDNDNNNNESNEGEADDDDDDDDDDEEEEEEEGNGENNEGIKEGEEEEEEEEYDDQNYEEGEEETHEIGFDEESYMNEGGREEGDDDQM